VHHESVDIAEPRMVECFRNRADNVEAEIASTSADVAGRMVGTVGARLR
jgi:hypothetical protein